jgi:hypothetical protein
MKKYDFHPLANRLPLLFGREFEELKSDMKANGQQVPAVLFEGKILDGRNRYRACQDLGIELRVVNYSKAQAKTYVISANLYRRHLTRYQQDELIRRLIIEQEALDLTNKEIAKVADVSQRTVNRAKRQHRQSATKEGGLAQSDNGEIVDANGTAIPPAALPYWNRIPEAKMVLGQIAAAKSQVKKLLPDDPMWARISLDGIIGDLGSVYTRFAAALPKYVCPYCKGTKPADCKFCKGRGVVSEWEWGMVPIELKPKSNQPF